MPLNLVDILNFSTFSFCTLAMLPRTTNFMSAVLIALGAGFVGKSGCKLYRINREKRNKKNQNNMILLDNKIELDELQRQIIYKSSRVDSLEADNNLTPVEMRMIYIRNLIMVMPLEYQIDYLNILNNTCQLYVNRKFMNIADNDESANKYLNILEININLILNSKTENNEHTEKIQNDFVCLKRVRKI